MNTLPRIDAIALTEAGPFTPNLRLYDVIVVNHSGGKDLAREYLDLEGRIDHRFKAGRSIGWYIDRAAASDPRDLVTCGGRS